MDRDFRSLCMRIRRFASEGGQESAIDLIRVTWNLCAVAAYVLDQRSGSTAITVMDQGLVQGLWSVRLKSRRRRTSEKWHDILSGVGMDDTVLVHLRGETGLARGRLLKRGDRSSRVQRASTGIWLEADRAYREMAADLAKGLPANEAAPLVAAIDVDASTSPEEVAERALDAVLLARVERHRLRNAANHRG